MMADQEESLGERVFVVLLLIAFAMVSALTVIYFLGHAAEVTTALENALRPAQHVQQVADRSYRA